jgi:uncharacterized RDD family membrane protein YckC
MLAGSPDAGPVPRLHTLSDIGRTASRRSRLIAAVVDSAVAVAVTVPAGVLGLLLATRFPGQGWLVVVLPGSVLLGYFLLQAVGLALRGQTIGKALDGAKVVRADGGPAGFLRVVFLRSIAMPLAAFVADLAAPIAEGVPGLLASAISPLVNLAMAVDVLLILTPQRRALHDYLAGTIVVEVFVPPTRRALARWIFIGSVAVWFAAILGALGLVVSRC